MEDKEVKKRLAKIPDADKNGDPIFKIAADVKPVGKKPAGEKSRDKRDSK